MRAFAFLALLPLIACGPVSVEQAERQCAARAHLAQKPQTSVSISIDSTGKTSFGGEFGVSTDYLNGADPNDVFKSCVQQQSGQLPTRSYTNYPKTAS
jgi:hypothetical protein